MEKPKVVVAEVIAAAGLEALGRSCFVDDASGADRAELMRRLHDAHGLVVRSATMVDAGLLAAAPKLTVVGRAGVGVDNIDLKAATERGVLVVNAPTANTISAAEHAMALILSQARNVPRADAALRSGVWDRTSFQGVELHGKTLGILGLGRIGSLVAERARAFGMTLIGYDPFVSPEMASRMGVEVVEDVVDLYAAADFITVHLPKTRETEGMLNADAFASMKPGVRIVNASRGGIVVESDLAEAVRNGIVAGAGLDVFEVEPLTSSPLFDLPQVVLTPHLGASTVEAQDKAGTDVATAVANALAGELVLTAVNVDLGREVSPEVRAFLPLVENLARVFVGIAKGLPPVVTLRLEGRIAEHPATPLRLATLKGALAEATTDTVSFVNAATIAEERGIRIVEEKAPDAEDYLSLVQLSGTFNRQAVSVSGTITRKGQVLVEIQGLELELPLHQNLLMVRNEDVPGLIGRVGTFLGDLNVNISDMVVGRMPGTGEAAMMGVATDSILTDVQVEALRKLDGIITARFVRLPDA